MSCRQNCSHLQKENPGPELHIAIQSTTSLLQSIKDILVQMLDTTSGDLFQKRLFEASSTTSRVMSDSNNQPQDQVDPLDSDASFASVEADIEDMIDLN